MVANWCKWLVCAAAVAGAIPATQPVDVRGLTEQALDEPVNVKLDNVRLADAFELIFEQTGVRVVMSEDTMRLAPHGPETRVVAEITSASLRQGLTDLLAPLGMSFTVTGDQVQVVPTPALARLGRQATWEDLETLGQVAHLQPGLVPEDLERLRAMVQFQVPDRDPWTRLAEEVQKVGAGRGDDVLDLACQRAGWSWTVSGRWVVVRSQQEQVAEQLSQPISLRMNGRPLIDVLQAVGRQLDINIRVDPGALGTLPAVVRQSFSLNVYQTSGADVLDKISAYTGLGYFIEPGGVLFYAASAPQAVTLVNDTHPAPTEGGDEIVGRIVVSLGVPGWQIEWTIRESELPPELKALREKHKTEAFTHLQELLSEGQNPEP